MTRTEKAALIDSMPVVAYWVDGLNGTEVRKIEYCPDGILFYIKDNVGCSNPSYHILKVVEKDTIDGGHSDYIRLGRRRLYLKDCIRNI